MRLREALREAWRDVVSGAGRPVTFTALHAVVVGGLILAAAVSSAQAVREARQFVASGAAVYVMKATTRIDGRACDAMSSLANVRAAGALREDGDGVSSARLPRTPISRFGVSEGFAALLPANGDARSGGLSLSTNAAAALGVEVGDDLAMTTGATRLASVFDYPDDGRDPVLAFAATDIVAGDAAPFDQCWAEIWPHDESAVAALGRTVLSSGGDTGERPTLVQLNQTHGSRFAGSALVDRRLAGPLVVAAGALLGALFVLRRRLVLASDRHVGVRRISQVASQAAQVLLWAVAGSTASTAAVLIAVRLPDEDRLPILLQSAALAVAASGAAVAACSIAVCLLRDKALFRYFKQR